MPEPLNRAMKPLLPALDVPLLRVRDPVTPLDTTFAELMVTTPEPELTLEPLAISTAPPSAPPINVDTPADMTTLLPATLFPAPTITLIEPPLPPVALPDWSEIQPLLPDLDVPELSRMVPDAAADKTLAVVITIEPEPELTLDPLVTTTAPPRLEPPKPPDTLTEPPVLPVVVEPLERTIPPAAKPPLVVVPTTMLIDPDLPPVLVPDNSERNPEFPDMEVPELKVREPLAPVDRTLAVAMTMEPDPELILLPLLINTLAPVAVPKDTPLWSVTAPDKTMDPATPLSLLPTTMLMVPPRPPVAVPVTIAMNPLLPDLEVPVLNVKLPDKPTDNALADETVIAPEPLLTLLPL